MKKVFTLSFLLIAVFLGLYAGTTGKIAGTIVDSRTGEPLPGVNIILVGTPYGAVSDFDGNYSIGNLPPGIYTIRASSIGYSAVSMSNVKVNIDLTSTNDFKLAEETVVGEEVVITAERQLVQKDLTSKTAVVGGDDIKALPVTEIGQVLSLQAGYVGGSLRGGRSGEVATWIDGVPVTDVYNGNQVVEINKSAVQELQLISGAFNAEYGQAMSGIVNIATREGGLKFTGGIGTYMGDYLSTNEELYPGLSFNPIHIRNIEGNISGPIIGEALTFFANARYIYFNGWEMGFRRFNPSNIAFTDSTNTFRIYRDASGKGDSAVVPLGNSERRYAQAKIAWKILPLMKLTGNFIFDYSTNKTGDKRMYRYNPDGIANGHDFSNTFIFQLSHTLNSNTYYTLGGSAFVKDSKEYLYENMNDSRYVHPLLFQTQDSYSFFTGGTDLRHNTRSTRTYLLKLDVSSQVNQMNLFKVGAEVRTYDIRQDNIQLQPINTQSTIDVSKDNPYIQTQVLDISSSSHNRYKHNPYEMSAYIQDKMEFKNIIVNIGVRFDYFEPDGKVLRDPRDPSIYTPIIPANRFHDLDGDGIQDAGETDKTPAERAAYWYKDATAKAQFSPRLGVSFPITDRGIVHFSYGHFFQVPRFERLYENPDFKIGQGTGNQGLIGNADLKPEETISAELGVQQQVSDDVALDVTAYIRDVRGLTGTRSAEIYVFGDAAKYSMFTNSDFGFVKGIVLTAEKRFSGGLTAKADYTFQIARGTASDVNEARNAVTSGALPEVQLVPLEWDQRHTLNVTVAYNTGSWLISGIGQYGSGRPYTPRKSQDISTLLTNSQLKPVSFNVDLNTSYEFSLDFVRMIVFARVFNVFDFRNETGVFDDTGRAGFTLDEATARKTNPSERVNTLQEWFTRAGNYSEPRRIEFGINLEF
ncbi:MAG: TonB-dependent receptor [Bacteroidota bacterium]|jgi:outer membrane receptor for ferrienterochelin and colicin